MESFTLHKAPKVWKYSLIWASKADTHFGCWRHWFSVTWILHTGNFTDVTGITWVLQWCHAKGGGSYESARKGRCRRDKMTRKTCKLDLAASSQHHLILKNAVPVFGTEEWPQLVAEALSPWVPEAGGAETWRWKQQGSSITSETMSVGLPSKFSCCPHSWGLPAKQKLNLCW